MNKEENILLQYQVRSKTTMGTRYYYFYAETDIENYLNSKNIKYVRYAKDTALNRKQKRILELLKENQQLKEQLKQKEDVINKAIKKWRVEGKQLRYELFYKSLEQTAFSIRQEYIIIPFFDLIPSTITRNDIYEMYNLKTKGYMLGE